MFSTIESALIDFAAGKMIIVTDDEDRENEGDIIFSAQFADENKMNFCIKNAGGLICAAISEEIAKNLGLEPMQRLNRDVFETAFYDSVDADPKHGVTTGISAADRAITARLLSDSKTITSDLRKPGHLFPVVAKKYGVLERTGHTESAVDLCKLSNLPHAAIMCEIIDADGTMMRSNRLKEFASTNGIKVISVQQIREYRIRNDSILIKSEVVNLPTEFGNFKMLVYKNPITNYQHPVLFKKDSTNTPILRIHSECKTGDIFGSLRCDCRQQLIFALEAIEKSGNGAVIYLDGHEGRGINLFNKINAYKLQEEGLNTFEANHKLGFDSDCRDYIDVAMILLDLQIDNFELVTGNSNKADFLNKFNFNFNCVLPDITITNHNKKYIEDKTKYMKHKFNLK